MPVTTYHTVHGVTAADIKVAGSTTTPVVRIGPSLDLYTPSLQDMVELGEEMVRQARRAQALAKQPAAGWVVPS